MWEAIAGIVHPDVANGRSMIAVALAAIVLNVLIGVWLYSGSQDKLNIRSAYLHMMGDAVAALGVVVACNYPVLVAEQRIREGQQVLRAVVLELAHQFHITHTTVQVEVEGCTVDDMSCVAKRARR